MKGMQGIAIAAALGVVGAVCNWLYVAKQAQDYEKVDFVVIKSGARINPGDVFKEEHFDKVSIPRRNLGNLERIAVRWEHRGTVVNFPAIKSYAGNELLLDPDVVTPSRKSPNEQIGEDQITFEVPVDSTAFVSENYNPGDYVYFLLPMSLPRGTAQTDDLEKKIAGPFKILALGNRTSSREVHRAARGRSSREDVITVGLTFKDGKFDEMAEDLLEILRLSGGKGVRVAQQSARKNHSRGS